MTAPDPYRRGARPRPSPLALCDAGIAPEAVAFVDVHGTGTQLNDAAEWQALFAHLRTAVSRRCRSPPPRPWSGHLLGSGRRAGGGRHRALPGGRRGPPGAGGRPSSTPSCRSAWCRTGRCASTARPPRLARTVPTAGCPRRSPPTSPSAASTRPSSSPSGSRAEGLERGGRGHRPGHGGRLRLRPRKPWPAASPPGGPGWPRSTAPPATTGRGAPAWPPCSGWTRRRRSSSG